MVALITRIFTVTLLSYEKNKVLLSGLLDNVARRAPAGTVKAGTKLQRDCAYLSSNEAITEPLYIKSTSVLFSRDPQELPEWVVYQVNW